MRVITIEDYTQMRKENEEWDDFIKNSPREFCPNCGNDFDDADFDFQICSRCGLNCNKELE